MLEYPVYRGDTELLHAIEADTFWTRMRGLHARPPLCGSQALVIRPCNSVHTFRMKYVIDVAFLDGDGVIQKLEEMKPGRVSWCRRANIVIEMRAGMVAKLSLTNGQTLNKEVGSWAHSSIN